MYQPRWTPPEVFRQTLKVLQQMLEISSPTNSTEGLWQAAEHWTHELDQRGLKTMTERRASNLGDVPLLHSALAAASTAASTAPLLLIGHLDTVQPAMPVRLTADRLWGTGATDMKGGLAAWLGALDLMRMKGLEPAPDLQLIVVPDEEIAGPICREAVAEYGAKARALWVLEPGRRDAASFLDGETSSPDGETSFPDGETIVIARRGLFHWHLEVTGQAAHAGNAFWQGRSALIAAAQWCAAVAALAEPERGPTINCARMVAGEQDFVGNLSNHGDLLGSPRQTNVVPDRAIAEGEARFTSVRDGQKIVDEMTRLTEQIGKQDGFRMEFSTSGAVAPLDPGDASRQWAQTAVDAAATAGWRLEPEDDRGGISFPNFLPDALPEAARIPVLDGLGPIGGGMHTRQEFVELQSLDRRIRLLADLLAADARQQQDARRPAR